MMAGGIEVTFRTFGVAVYPPGASFGPRHLRDYEFVWILEGDVLYTWEMDGQSQTIEAPPGTLILCRAGARDSFRWDPQKRTRHGFFHFRIRHIGEEWPPLEIWPVACPIDDDTILAPLFRHILTWRQKGDALQRDLTAGLFLRAFVTGQTSIGELPPGTVPEAVERATRYIFEQLEENPAAPMALDDLARAAFVTPEHLCRIFKSSTGCTPLRTVRLARLDRAAVLLSRSNYTVAQVAQICGFASPFHFSRAFKEEYKMSPRELRTALDAGKPMPLPRLLRNPLR